MKLRTFRTVCQNMRCIGDGELLTGFVINDEKARCEVCGQVAAALAMARFYVDILPDNRKPGGPPQS